MEDFSKMNDEIRLATETWFGYQGLFHRPEDSVCLNKCDEIRILLGHFMEIEDG